MATQVSQVLTGLYGDVGMKAPVVAASTASLPLYGLTPVDGYTPVIGDAILEWKNVNPALNGIYTADVGAWERRADFSASSNVANGTLVYCSGGNANAGDFFICNTGNITFDTTPISISKMAVPPVNTSFASPYVIQMEDFIGATWNPANDYSTQFNLAVGLLAAVGGGEIKGARPYIVNSPIVINADNISIRGVARGKDQTGGFELYSTTGTNSIIVQGSDLVTHYNLTLDNVTVANKVGVTPTSVPLISLTKSNGISLKRMRIRNYYNGCYLAGLTNFDADDVILSRGVGAYGFWLDWTTYQGAVHGFKRVNCTPMDGLNANNTATSTAQAAGLGSRSFTLPTGLDLLVGQPVEINPSDGTAGIQMNGTVSSYNSATGVVVVNVTQTQTDVATTKTSWIISAFYRAGHYGLKVTGGSSIKAWACEFNRCDTSYYIEQGAALNLPEFFFFTDCTSENSRVGAWFKDYSRVVWRGAEISQSRNFNMQFGGSVEGGVGSGSQAGNAFVTEATIDSAQWDGIYHCGGRTELDNNLITGNGLFSAKDNPQGRLYSGVKAFAGNLYIRGGKIGGSGSKGATGTNKYQNYGVDIGSLTGADPVEVAGVDLEGNYGAGVSANGGVYDPNGYNGLWVERCVGYQNAKAATSSASAVTCHAQSGIITTEALTTANGALYHLAITNNKVNTSSRIVASLQNGTNTVIGACLSNVSGNNSNIINIYINNNSGSALNGTLVITFTILNSIE